MTDQLAQDLIKSSEEINLDDTLEYFDRTYSGIKILFCYV